MVRKRAGGKVGQVVASDDEFDFLGGTEPVQAALDPALAALADRIASDVADDVVAAVGEAQARGLAELQVPVIERLGRDPKALGHAAVDACLRYLDALADGRGVRAMETVLAENGREFSDAHAWKLRHVVQRVRRMGRK